MKFRLLIEYPNGTQGWEHYNYAIGERRPVRGYPQMPAFEGDIDAFGRALVEWYNAGCLHPDSHRKYIRGEPEASAPATDPAAGGAA